MCVRALGWEDPVEEGMQPTLVFLLGESHGQMEPGGVQTMELQKFGYNLA